MRSSGLFSLFMVLILCGCNAQPAKPAGPPAPDYKAVYPIEEVMGHVIMPNADLLWGSVATNVTAKGVEEIVPKTEDDWERVRNYAVTLVEGTNLLLIPAVTSQRRARKRRMPASCLPKRSRRRSPRIRQCGPRTSPSFARSPWSR